MPRHSVPIRAARFGGILLAAAQVPASHAQVFGFEPNQGGALPLSEVSAFATDGVTPTACSHAAHDPADAIQAASVVGFAHSASARVGLDEVRASAVVNPVASAVLARGTAFAHASLAADATLTVRWDFADEEPGVPFSRSSVSVVDAATGVAIFEVTPGDAGAGEQPVALQAGVLYELRVEAWALAPDGAASAELTLAPVRCAYCDLDANGHVNVDDVDTFIVAFLNADPVADCDGCGIINLGDVDCFIECFLDGCP